MTAGVTTCFRGGEAVVGVLRVASVKTARLLRDGGVLSLLDLVGWTVRGASGVVHTVSSMPSRYLRGISE